MRFEALSQRGGIFVWRQGSGAPPTVDAGTLAPCSRWQLRVRGNRGVVYVKTRNAAASSVTLSIADATHAHSAEAVVLGVTGATTLTVADAAHAHTVDGITLSAQSVLAIQDALHAHAADGITLDASGAAVLLLADALHAHAADGVALTVDAWLVVADAVHTHAADSVVLVASGSGTGATAAEIWSYTLSNGLTAEATLVAVHTMLSELHLIPGLTAGSPLSVTAASRAAGAVSQAVAEAAGTVTVTRQ